MESIRAPAERLRDCGGDSGLPIGSSLYLLRLPCYGGCSRGYCDGNSSRAAAYYLAAKPATRCPVACSCRAAGIDTPRQVGYIRGMAMTP